MGRSVLNKNMTIIKDSKYIKSKGIALEEIESRVKVGFFRCPSCNNWLGLYKEEIDVNNITRKPKKCKCGFYDKVELEDWDD